jgi:hypothetical protein
MSIRPPLTALLRTADRTRKVEVDLDPDQPVARLVEAAVRKWRLPPEGHYGIVNVSRNRALGFAERIGDQVSSLELLELQPVLVAG